MSKHYVYVGNPIYSERQQEGLQHTKKQGKGQIEVVLLMGIGHSTVVRNWN